MTKEEFKELYNNFKSSWSTVDFDVFEKKWIAYYDDTIYYPYAFKVWQYSDTGTVNGITGNVDLNISFEDLADE